MTRNLRGLHDFFLYASLFLGFLAVASGSYTPIWLLVGFPSGMIAAHFFHRSGRARPAHNKWWNALIIAALLASITQYFFDSLLDVMAIGVRFVLVLTLIKLFSRQGPRDELQIYALSFLTMAAASALSEDVAFGILFGIYVLTGTFSLALFHLKTEAERHPQVRAPRDSPFDKFYISTLAGISLLIFASSLLIFFAFPRIGLGFFADASRNNLSISGFSENIDVGNHGAVRDNPAVVMRVEFDGEPPSNYGSFQWRAMTFDHFDGKSWSRTRKDTDTRAGYTNARNYDLDFLHTPRLQQSLEDGNSQQIEIYLEPLGRNVLPILWPSEHLRIGAADNIPMLNMSTPALFYDDYGDLSHSMPGDVSLYYELTIQRPPPPELLRRSSGRSLNDEDAERYLQLENVDPRIEQLANELTDGLDSNYERAEAIGAHFVEEFEYTLDLPEVQGDDPIAEFLFDHQEGHCEYFASSAAVLLRSAGVPTRMVNGFLGGTWNDVGDYLTVRQGDAHAWIEIYVPELGWVPFEATPPINSSFMDRAGITQLFSDGMDAMRYAWVRWVLEYDLQAQGSLFRDIARNLAPASADNDDSSDDKDEDEDDEEGISIPLRPIVFWCGWLLLGLATYWRARTYDRIESWRYGAGFIVAILAGAFWAGWFQGWAITWTGLGAISIFAAGAIPAAQRHGGVHSDLRLATNLFTTIERKARRSNLARRPDEGPGDFLHRLAGEYPAAASAVESFRTLYLDTRFGARELSDAERDRLKRAARSVVRGM